MVKSNRKRDLFSLYDQTDAVSYARQLVNLGWAVVATAETEKLLKEHDVPVEGISTFLGAQEVYPFPPTLHPAMELALTSAQGEPIDLVYDTTYPLSEGNDVGGRTLLALAAKGERIVVCDGNTTGLPRPEQHLYRVLIMRPVPIRLEPPNHGSPPRFRHDPHTALHGHSFVHLDIRPFLAPLGPIRACKFPWGSGDYQFLVVYVSGFGYDLPFYGVQLIPACGDYLVLLNVPQYDSVEALAELAVLVRPHQVFPASRRNSRVDGFPHADVFFQGYGAHSVVRDNRFLRFVSVQNRDNLEISLEIVQYVHFEDHWVCEYWHAEQARWLLVDAQLDALQCEVLKIPFNTLDVPREQFIVGGAAWQLCRSHQADPEQFGIFDMHGIDFVKGDFIRDVAALNKMELVPWDCWGLIEMDYATLTSADLAMLDHLADLTHADVPNFDAVRQLYEGDPRLRVGKRVHSYYQEGHS